MACHYNFGIAGNALRICSGFFWYHRSRDRCIRWDMLQPKSKVTRFLTSRIYSPGRKHYSEISRLDHDRYPNTLRGMLERYTTLDIRVFVGENISCSSKIELPYFSVEAYPISCIYCGIGGTKRTLNKSVEHYPQCQSCSDKPNVLRRKRKTVVEGVFTKRRNNDHSNIRY